MLKMHKDILQHEFISGTGLNIYQALQILLTYKGKKTIFDTLPKELTSLKKTTSNIAQIRWVSNPLDTELCNACRQGDIKGVQQAIEKGADPNCHINNALGETIPMAVCANKGYTEIAALLVAKGVKPTHTVGFDGSTPLHVACRANQMSMVTFLIDQGYDINSPNKLNRTPLMEASAGGNIDLVKLLCQKGADINQYDQLQKTALRFSKDSLFEKKTLCIYCMYMHKQGDLFFFFFSINIIYLYIHCQLLSLCLCAIY
ncbi:Ankyrin, partial [Reticulomyxa filosa]